MKYPILYTSNTCPKCKIIKTLIQNKKLDYQEINVDVDKESFDRLIKKNIMSLPVVETALDVFTLDYTNIINNLK